MQMVGEQRIAAPRQRVWEALNDPEILRASIPGCQSLERDGESAFNAVAEVKIGPIGARFRGAVTLSDLDAPNGYTITGSGNGGIAGSARGGARVRLSDDGAGTLVSYEVDAEVGGRMAQLGGPIIDATAKNLAGKFFARFGEIVGDQAAAPAAPEPSTPVPSLAAAAPAQPATAPAATPAPATAAAPAPVYIAAPAAAPASTAASASFPWSWVSAMVVAIVAGFLLGRSQAADWTVMAMIVLAVVIAGAGFESGRRAGGGA